MRSTGFMLIIVLATAVAGCGGSNVRVDEAARVDFSRYDTWRWADYRGDASPEVQIRELEPELMTAVDARLTDKGFRQVDRRPDFLVAYHIVATTRMPDDDVGISPAWPMTEEMIVYHEEGTLILDIIDAEDNTVIWRGWAMRSLDRLATADPENIRSAVDEILDRYPNN